MCMMQELGNKDFDLDAAKDMLDDIDRDDDGKINFLEFTQIMMYDTLDQELMHIMTSYGKTNTKKS